MVPRSLPKLGGNSLLCSQGQRLERKIEEEVEKWKYVKK